MLLLLVLQRVICAMTLATSSVPYPDPVVLAALAAWNVSLFAIAGRQGRVSGWMAAVDIGLAVTLLALAAKSGQDDWAYRAALSASAMAGATLNLMPAAFAVAALAAAFTAETLVRKGDHVSPVSLAGDLSLLLVFAVILGSGAHSLRRYVRRADRAVFSPSDLMRDLHDTALATLSAIASGRVDYRTEQVRSRAARDVAYIRRLLLSDSADGETLLAARLREVVGMAELLGLTVHWQGDRAPSDLPPEAVAALADATREALNNVASHAGTEECWLTLIVDGAGVTVRVVDRGRGFDSASRPPGFGLRRSLTERMAACGGAVRVSSAPDTGTCVDLTWRKRST
ncbi:MAG: hypothetical protein JO242_01585 [Streptosporangiaceae bacterium]|nr:hypothetical protein [Streptosporangiaceae bacterium]